MPLGWIGMGVEEVEEVEVRVAMREEEVGGRGGVIRVSRPRWPLMEKGVDQEESDEEVESVPWRLVRGALLMVERASK